MFSGVPNFLLFPQERALTIADYGLFAACGAFGCTTTHLTVVPLDVVKTRLQTEPGRYEGLAEGVSTIAREVRRKGVRGCVLSIGVFCFFFHESSMFGVNEKYDAVGQIFTVMLRLLQTGNGIDRIVELGQRNAVVRFTRTTPVGALVCSAGWLVDLLETLAVSMFPLWA